MRAEAGAAAAGRVAGPRTAAQTTGADATRADTDHTRAGGDVRLDVRIVIPARNEARNLDACLAAAAASGAVEIVVVDDDSSDATAAIARNWAARDRRIEVLRLGPLEADDAWRGWAGKNRACWLGAEGAERAWLLFLDADARLRPGGLAAALRKAEAEGLDALSLSPEQECGSWAEAAVVPLVFTLLNRCYAHGERGGEAAANGQFFLWRRAAYRRVGGHAAVRGSWLEDVALARRLRDGGGRLALLPGTGCVRARMYRGWREVCRGWGKNAVPLFGWPWAWPPGPAARALAAPWIVLAAAVGCGAAGWGWPAAVLALGLAALHGDYARRLPRGERRYAVWLLPGSAAYAAIWWSGAWRRRKGTLRWKDRAEPPAGTER